MTDKEIVQALRCCRLGKPCTSCPGAGTGRGLCFDEVHAAAVAAIERLTAENVILPDGQASAVESLRKEIEWKDMVIVLAQRKQAEAEAERDALLEIAKKGKDCETCKNCDSCKRHDEVEGICYLCGPASKCPCYDCRGAHWEWRGLPDAPTEGEKA